MGDYTGAERRMITVELDAKAIMNAQGKLQHIPGGVQKAAARAVKRAVESARTTAVRETVKGYNITRDAVLATIKMNPGTLSGELTSRGGMIPLSAFKARPGPPVTAKIKRRSSSSGEGKGGFWQKMPTVGFGEGRRAAVPGQSHEGVFGRVEGTYMKGRGPRAKKRGTGMTKGREAIAERYGPSVPQMLMNQEISQKIGDRIVEQFSKRLDHEVGRILDKEAGK